MIKLCQTTVTSNPVKMLNHPLIFICCLSLFFGYSYLQKPQYLLEVDDLEKLDAKIASFLKNPNFEGWEDNMKDIEFFEQSMKHMIKTLNATFEGLTKEYIRKVEKFIDNGKPLFIDTCVVEAEIQPLINVSDEQLVKLHWIRVYCQEDWELLIDLVKLKKQIEIILPEN